MIRVMLAAAALAVSGAASAKLPALDDAAKAKAAEAAAKTAWQGKVEAYQLCKAQDKVAAHHQKTAGARAAAGTAALPPCADPGPFAYTPPQPATPPQPPAQK